LVNVLILSLPNYDKSRFEQQHVESVGCITLSRCIYTHNLHARLLICWAGKELRNVLRVNAWLLRHFLFWLSRTPESEERAGEKIYRMIPPTVVTVS
jgi:hypothetical protein